MAAPNLRESGNPESGNPESGRELLVPLLRRRYRLLGTVVLVGSVVFAGLHVLFREQQLGFLLAMKVLQVTTLVITLWISEHARARTAVVAAIVASSIVINGVTAGTGLLIGNVHTNSLLFVVAALATSSFVPWGPRAQAVSVASAALASLATLYASDVATPNLHYDFMALLLAFATSILIAREVEKDTIAEIRSAETARALAESRADFEGVFRSSNVLLALIELHEDDFVYAEANETVARLFGRTPETIRGATGREVGFPADDGAMWRKALERCAVQGEVHVPEYCIEFLEPRRWYHVGLSAIRDGDALPTRFSAVGVDITEFKQATEDVRRLNLDLEAQVRARTALLEVANKDLEAFAYSVSHDLRTPLRSIEGFAALLADDHASELSPPAVAQLDRIRGASRHMSQLIDDMLMLSRASRAGITRETIDLSALARSVAGELVADARATARVVVEVEPGMSTFADAHLMRIVLTNLLGNACKYASRAAGPRIVVGRSSKDGEAAFFVRDNGCGFDMRFVHKLFQPFQRLHSAEEFEGTGIGLATVARIVRRHGGRVWAEGEPGRGATFSFSIGGTGQG